MSKESPNFKQHTEIYRSEQGEAHPSKSPQKRGGRPKADFNMVEAVLRALPGNEKQLDSILHNIFYKTKKDFAE